MATKPPREREVDGLAVRGVAVWEVVDALEGVNEQSVDLLDESANLGWAQRSKRVRHFLRRSETEDVIGALFSLSCGLCVAHVLVEAVRTAASDVGTEPRCLARAAIRVSDPLRDCTWRAGVS